MTRGSTAILARGSTLVLACDRRRILNLNSRLLSESGSDLVLACYSVRAFDGRAGLDTSALILKDVSSLVLDPNKRRVLNGDSTLTLDEDGSRLVLNYWNRRSDWCRIRWRHRRAVTLLASNGWRCGYWYPLGSSNKDKTPLNIVTRRTHERAMLEASDQHGVVLDSAHQDHFGVAEQTTHHTLPRPSAMPFRSIGAKCGSTVRPSSTTARTQSALLRGKTYKGVGG
jgi:hypothetical protein